MVCILDMLNPPEPEEIEEPPPLDIGSPYNVQHDIHVDFQSDSGFMVRILLFYLLLL